MLSTQGGAWSGADLTTGGTTQVMGDGVERSQTQLTGII